MAAGWSPRARSTNSTRRSPNRVRCPRGGRAWNASFSNGRRGTSSDDEEPTRARLGPRRQGLEAVPGRQAGGDSVLCRADLARLDLRRGVSSPPGTDVAAPAAVPRLRGGNRVYEATGRVAGGESAGKLPADDARRSAGATAQ